MTVYVTLKSGREVPIYGVVTVTEEIATIWQGTYRDSFVTGTVFGYLTGADDAKKSPDEIMHVAPRKYTYDETWFIFSDATPTVLGKYRKSDTRGWRNGQP